MTPDDIITASNRAQERQKKSLGYQRAVNFAKPFSEFGLRDWTEWTKDRVRDSVGGYRSLRASYYACWPHMPASAVRAHVGEEVWNSYYKFAVERDPWDKLLSLFYFRKWQGARGLKRGLVDEVDDGLRDEFKTWLLRHIEKPSVISDAWMYCEDEGRGDFMLDQLIRYDDLQSGLNEVTERLGLPEHADVGRDKFSAHGGIRQNGAGRELFSPDLDAIVRDVFNREIEILGLTGA